APLAKIEAFKKRMGWAHRWLSSEKTDFNQDYGVTDAPAYNYGEKSFKGEAPGVSVFLREGNDVFHTYSSYARGLDLLINTYNYIDLTPLGRQEESDSNGMKWVRLH